MERAHQYRHQHRSRNSSSSHSSSSSSSLNESSRSTPHNTNSTKFSRFNPNTRSNHGPNNTTGPRDGPEWKPRRGSSSSSNTHHQNLKTGAQADEVVVKDEDSSSFPILIGTCPFMCPEGERAQREQLRDLAVFERLHGNPRKTSPSLAVKKVKFHVVSHHKLRCCGSSANVSSVHYLNMEQLIKALTSLFELYDANRNANSIYENEAEFCSLYVLLHLDSRSQSTGESLSLWFRHVPRPIIKSEKMCFARSILRSFRMGNYKLFFCTIAAKASYLQYCIIESYINEVRALSLSCINNVGYKLHPYPLVHLSKLLMMKESDLEQFCNACGLETSTDEMGNKSLPTKQTTFCVPKGGFQSSNFPGLEQFER
ncbi:SAC3 family protein C isoform X2 [Hevea brasiliensis]|uniref:SAC3 family protein C isoform X2 n=1 Tax=Hevea brasiliensis TaxID=3981 RepID=UPI0025D5C2CE|nr:SAC3 family protein C isoform X2 [Hevea brasiliensis]